jgi:hypothetical protein
MEKPEWLCRQAGQNDSYIKLYKAAWLFAPVLLGDGFLVG